MERKSNDKAGRAAEIEARLRHERPIWKDHTRELYSIDGSLVARITEGGQIIYLDVTSEGQVRDLLDFRVEKVDVRHVVICLNGVGLADLKAKVETWSLRTRKKKGR